MNSHRDWEENLGMIVGLVGCLEKFMLDTSYLIAMRSNKNSQDDSSGLLGGENLFILGREIPNQKIPKRPCRWQGKFPSVADG